MLRQSDQSFAKGEEGPSEPGRAWLVADLSAVTEALGEEFASQLTYPGIYRGAPLSVSPVIVERGRTKTVIVSDADSDACKVMVPGFARMTYGRYFSWDNDPSASVASFSEAVWQAAGDGPIVCDAALPAGRYEQLAARGPVVPSKTRQVSELHVYTKARSEVEAQWLATRDADTIRLAPFIATLPHGETLLEACRRGPRGYAPLDALCAENDLDAILVTAPHEVEMFCGLPARAITQHGVAALFVPGAPAVFLLAVSPLQRADLVTATGAAGLPEALARGGFRRIGVQKDHLAVADYLPLLDTGLVLVDAGHVLRRWQDRRAGDDLVYFILAGNAVLHGIAGANAFFRRNGGAMTERDLVAAHHQAVRRFAGAYGFGERVSSYFDIVHSGARTHLPATAGDYPVSASDRTIKFDMGLQVADAFGCLRGCSDIARTICRDADVEAMHDRLRAILVDELIPAIRPGMRGRDVHAIGVDRLLPLEGELRRLNLLPQGRGVDGYVRDCGHTLQRQTISSVYFLPHVDESIESGMLGCVEYVWPIGDVLIAVEDGFLVTEDGAIPFTANVRS